MKVKIDLATQAVGAGLYPYLSTRTTSLSIVDDPIAVSMSTIIWRAMAGIGYCLPMPGTGSSPRVTMVVATLDEAATIERCLLSLADQDYPADELEVMVYDGGSRDATRSIAEAFAAGRSGWSVRTNQRRVQAAAWNAGVQASSGDIVGIVSGHSELGPSYVRRVVEVLTSTGADMVGGPVHAVGEGTIGEAAAVAMSTPFGVGSARHHYLTEPGEVDTVFMGVCRRETWLRFPFDESMVRNQDDEMSYRLLDAGGRIVCDPVIESRYRNRSTLTSLWRQYFDYGRWKILVLRRHPRQVRLRHLAPVGLVLTIATGLLLGAVLGPARIATLAVVGLYAVATIMAAIRYGDWRRPRSAAALLVVYPTLHLAYGLGMIAGFVRFILLRRGRTPLATTSDRDGAGNRPSDGGTSMSSEAP